MHLGIKNNINDFLRSVSITVSAKDRNICKKTIMRKRLERYDLADIISETNGIGLDRNCHITISASTLKSSKEKYHVEGTV